MPRGDRAHPDAGALAAVRSAGERRVVAAPVVDPVLGITGPPPEPVVEPEPAEPKVKVGFYVPESEAGRIRAAFVFTRRPGDRTIRSLSDFIAAAMREHVDALEAERGEPFVPLDPGVIPTGRPLEV